ncbi:four helix bundle protein [Cytophagales bacterium LB-30]|uniref:Four helix bundle protein n=1 Tax=Shiella aurantiaca TaxID=3058365 RepID=A0ABT8F0K4_9BACT|nr:four helix bundle protein [Shiella aurantiaca]MDN4163913.1 four helix bundle protein [Shiella aurantiaca]
MATWKTFEDIEAWQRARQLSQEIYSLTLLGSFAKDFGLRDQINRASGSIMDNIAEGFDRGGKKEFINFLSYAKGSAGEVKSQLYRALDREYIEKIHFEKLFKETDELGKMIAGLMNYLNKSEYQGLKFKDRVE